MLFHELTDIHRLHLSNVVITADSRFSNLSHCINKGLTATVDYLPKLRNIKISTP